MSRPFRDRRTRRAMRQAANPPGLGPRQRRSLRFEPLECRRLLAITVNTPFDELDGSIVDGDISLRDAIAAASAGETIDFDPMLTVGGPTTIVLAFGELSVNKPLSIVGPGANLLTVDGRSRGRIFNVDDGNAALADVAISGLTLTGGHVTGFAFGGAVRNAENLSLREVAIAGNSAFFGGGIWNGFGKLAVAESTISGNSASNGGGIFGGAATSTQTTLIVNSTISGNTASIAGGGLFTFDGVTTVRHSTITNNMTAGEGHGVASYANATTESRFYSTIIAGNGAPSGSGDVDLFGGTGANSFHSDGYNLIGDGTGLAAFNNNDQTNFADPLLGPLADNGGPTPTHALLNGSPAANGGDPAAVAEVEGVPEFDQRGEGFPRVVYGRIDIGAFEAPFVVGADLVVDILVDEMDGNVDPGDLSLREAIGLANLDSDVQVITFAPALTSGGPAEMTLVLGQLTIDESLIITGPGANLLTIDADGDSRVFRVDNSADDTFISVTLSGLTLTGGNVQGSGDGGAIFNAENLTIHRSVISGNTAVGGGGIYTRDGNLTITQSTLSGNSATLSGGGVLNLGGTLSVTGSTLSGNSAKDGGGLVSDTLLAGRTTTITNSTISGNTATVRGGGLLNLEGLTVIRHSTITNNTAPGGGGSGVASYGTELTRSEVHSTIVTGNTHSDIDVVAGITNSFLSFGYNLVGTGSGSGGFTMPGDQTGLTGVQLGPLANNGGPTRTHALLLGSPAINAGDPMAIAGMNGVPESDQRGEQFPRVAYGRIDIGAFEAPFLVGTSLVVDTLADEQDDNFNPGDLSLREAIGLANLDADPQTITFAPALTSGGPAEITLVLGELSISQPLTLSGPGAILLTIDGDGNSRLFNIADGVNDAFISVTLSNMTLTGGNVAGSGDGGAISNHENLTIVRSVISGNAAIGGGGIYSHGGSLTISQSTVSGNSASLYGGGIHHIGGNLTVTDSTISGNSAKGGGGVLSDTNLSNHTTTITSSTISGNTAAVRGGGMLNLEGLTVIRHSTITNNTAPAGGGSGVASYGSELTRTEIHSTIVTGNTNSDVDVVTGAHASFLSLGYNLVGTGSGTTSFTTPGDQAGVVDVQLGPLANNGGPTRTHALLLNSPAINAGDPAAVAGRGAVPTFDQRGESFFRVAGDRIDIGAFENQKPDIVVDILMDESDGNVSPGDLSLREAIALANTRSDAPVIRFAAALTSGGPATLPISLGELTIQRTSSVIGPGANLLTIDANDSSRIFRIDDGDADALIEVEIGSLALTDGKSATAGGAIQSLEKLTLTRVSITENFASLGGGVSSAGELSVVDSTISGNTATMHGGGIHSTGELSVTNSTISGNTATGDGGGIFNQGKAVIRHSTITANSAQASRGGGAASSGAEAQTQVHSTIIAGNMFSDVEFFGADINSFVSNGFNLVGIGGAVSVFNQPSDETGISNPLLAPLAFNGGPTRTHALLSNSPAINAGDPTAASGMNDVPAFDQRGEGFARVQNGRIDIGALESPFFVGISIMVDTLVDELDGNIGPGDLSLREAIGLANFEPDLQTITFAPALTSSGPATISLALGELAIRETVTINGPGANLLAIDAHGASRVFIVDDGSAGSSKLIDVTLRDLTVTGGRVIGFNYGGGILNHENLTITASAVTGNSADFFGGGIWTGFGSLNVLSSTISGNQASHGAGIFRGTNLSTEIIALTNSTVSGNTATVSGGGILNMSGVAEIRHSTITANTAPVGGGSGVASYGSNAARTNIYSTIIAGNNGSDVDLFGGGGTNTFHSEGYNLIGTGNALAAFTSNDHTGVTEPRLHPLASNGGPTRTHALAAGSPAFNTGDPAAEAGVGGVPEVDQRGTGFARVALGSIDIGAFEAQNTVPTLAGDYNRDATVDTADYVVWRNALGSTVPPFTGADGDGSGIVDQADLAVWRANFGRTLPPVVPVAVMASAVEPTNSTSQPQLGTTTKVATFPVNTRLIFDTATFQRSRLHDTLAPPPRLAFSAHQDALPAVLIGIRRDGGRYFDSPGVAYIAARGEELSERVGEALDALDRVFELLGYESSE